MIGKYSKGNHPAIGNCWFGYEEVRIDDGRFIQFYIDGKPYLRYNSLRSHHNLLFDAMVEEFELYSVGDDLPLKGSRHNVVGMGYLRIVEDEGQVVIKIDRNARSLTYKLRPDNEHMERIRQIDSDVKIIFVDG